MISPGPKQHFTGLLVVREPLHVHRADALQHAGEVVVHSAVRVDVRPVLLQTDELGGNATMNNKNDKVEKVGCIE